jgi:streptogramin lyase
MRSSLRPLILAALLAGCASTPAPLPAPPPAPPDLDALERDATSAYEHKDFARFLARSEELLAAAPGEPRRLYNVACGQSLSGKSAQAIKSLQSLAERSVYFDIAADTDFDPLASSPDLPAVRARFEALKSVVVKRSEIAFQLTERDLIPEGLAHDPGDGAFFVSSVHKRKIVRIDASGVARDFTTPGQDGLGAVLALAVDPPRHALYACSAMIPEMEGFRADEKGQSSLHQLDLATGKLTRKLTLTGPGKGHVCNDLAIDAGGVLFVSDSLSGAVYTANPGEDALTPLLPPGILKSPQGIVVSPDGRTLYIADYSHGVVRVDRATRRVTPLPGPPGVFLTGLDALALHGNDLIATQNGITPHRLIRARLGPGGDRITAVEILEINHPLYREPTLGTVVGAHFFYIANSQWDSFDKNGVLAPLDHLQAPVILDARLE